MKRIALLFFLAIIVGTAFSQEYPLKTIQEIRQLDGVAEGDTVKVQGVVMTAPVVDPFGDRRPIIWAGARWYAYIQDPESQPFGGMVVIQHDTSEAMQQTNLVLADSAEVYQFTIVVSKYFNVFQGDILLDPISPIEFVRAETRRPEPLALSIADMMTGDVWIPEATQYQSMYVRFENIFTSDRNTSDGSFRINDDQGNSMLIYDQSGYFTKRSHRLTGLTEYEPPVNGTKLHYIQGIVNERQGEFRLIPVYPGDIDENPIPPPSISNVERDEIIIASNQDVVVTANIEDADGTVASANLLYRVNQGAYTELPMSSSGDIVYTATIPGVSSDSAIVDYYIIATDNDGFSSVSPSDTARNKYFYQVLNRALTIQDVQYAPFSSGYSAYYSGEVTVSGIVTADTTDGNRVYIQNDEGEWSGIWAQGVPMLGAVKGDDVTVTGEIWEDYGVTYIDVTDITVNSSGNDLPQPELLYTGDIAQEFNGELNAEAYESVLVEYQDLIVAETSADGSSNYGEILVDDGSGGTRVELQDGKHNYHNNWEDGLPGTALLQGAQIRLLRGVLYYSFGNYKLVPRNDGDFGGVVDVEDNNTVPETFVLDQNYPNPFNPVTTIQYAIPNETHVTVEVYSLLGEKVATLVNTTQNAGTYKVAFNGNNVSSGIYFYKLQAGAFVSVKKMILMK